MDVSIVRPFLLAFVFERDFLKNLGARGRLSSYFHESSSTYNATQKLYRVSHTEHEREREERTLYYGWFGWHAG